ncbi:MAG: hypothetical protein RI580_08785 [Halothece sp. Uz-M2-17]|nr:hypothetical protein [Halothece sp. Uz-M2-17]
MLTQLSSLKILVDAVAAGVITSEHRQRLISQLATYSESIAIAQSFNNPKLVRELRRKNPNSDTQDLDINLQGNQVFYQDQQLGKLQILYKPPLPGELQAKLAYESIIDRFLEYLRIVHKIIDLQESDSHVQVFVPITKAEVSFEQLWKEFIEKVAFSTKGYSEYQIPDLIQTFILVLNTVTLSRGFSTLDIPIVTQDQSEVIAAWYFAVIKAVEKRQRDRAQQIHHLEQALANSDLGQKERSSKEKDLKKRQEMQEKEAKKYNENFQKVLTKFLNEQQSAWEDLESINLQLEETDLSKKEANKLQKQKTKISSKLILPKKSVEAKLDLLKQVESNPFDFVTLDENQNPDKFKGVIKLSKLFRKTATDQINSTRGDIFTQCVLEMYRLLENEPSDPIPDSLLSETLKPMEARSAGDESKDFCYSCGKKLDSNQWQVIRFIFQSPDQRRQSASTSGRPYICSSCSALAFASPLKVTDESIILKLEAKQKRNDNSVQVTQEETENSIKFLKLKDYLRMLTNKTIHLTSGRYIVLASDKTNKGDSASKKLGQVQYTLAKVASIFPQEVLSDFSFRLELQGREKKLENRHLVLIKGFMQGYGQSIINAGKEINLTLGDAVRYVEKDLPYLAEYTLVKQSKIANRLLLNETQERYDKQLQEDTKGDSMSQLKKRADLYRHVAALTGLTYAFAQSLESRVRKVKPQDADREVSKLIEQVDDSIAFCYYATLGDESQKNVQSRLYKNPANHFIYEQTKQLLELIEANNREEHNQEKQETWLQLYADDINKAYTYFAENGYSNERDWNELTYNLKLSLYTRFPELVRKLTANKE